MSTEISVQGEEPRFVSKYKLKSPWRVYERQLRLYIIVPQTKTQTYVKIYRSV